jgi:hypothetical protein
VLALVAESAIYDSRRHEPFGQALGHDASRWVVLDTFTRACRALSEGLCKRQVIFHGFTGDRMTYLIIVQVVLPYMLWDIAWQEQKRMNDAIDAASNDDIVHGQRHVDDPSIKIGDTARGFALMFAHPKSWGPLLGFDQFDEGIEQGICMMGALKKSFPEKSGEKMCWNFPKLNDVIHIPLCTISVLFGWIENFQVQVVRRESGLTVKYWKLWQDV